MVTESLVPSKVRETVVLQDHGSSLSRVGTVVLSSIDCGCALHDLPSREVEVCCREACSRVEDGADGCCQALRLRQEGIDEILVVWAGEKTALEQVIGTQKAVSY